MPSGGVKTPIEPGVIARVVAGVRYALTGVGPADWFGPGQPLLPVAQDAAQGRQFDYGYGINTTLTPRAGEAVTFVQLRALADSLDILRLAIETRKDQMAKQEWVVRPKEDGTPPDDRCKLITDLLAFPDKEHDFATWLRMMLEDLFVIDAPCVYPRKTRGGGMYSLDLIDGSTIKRLLNPDGRTPIAPDPAYQQIIKGLPAVDYSRDELLYAPRNPRTYKVYGYSPVEQIIMTVNIAIRRQLGQLAYYTDGSTPDLIFSVPDTWNPEQIKQFKAYWDSLLVGNDRARRGTMFVPNGVAIHDTMDRKLKDDFDEWLTRIVCYSMSLPPTAFSKQVNRATAGVSQDAALEEGLAPIMAWVKSVLTQIIQRWMGFTDLEFAWQTAVEVDQLAQAQIDQIYVVNKVVTPDEVRENSLGLDPLTAEQQKVLAPPPMPMPGMDASGKPLPPGHPGSLMPKPDAPPLAASAGKIQKKRKSRRWTENGVGSRVRARRSPL